MQTVVVTHSFAGRRAAGAAATSWWKNPCAWALLKAGMSTSLTRSSGGAVKSGAARALRSLPRGSRNTAFTQSRRTAARGRMTLHEAAAVARSWRHGHGQPAAVIKEEQRAGLEA